MSEVVEWTETETILLSSIIGQFKGILLQGNFEERESLKGHSKGILEFSRHQ